MVAPAESPLRFMNDYDSEERKVGNPGMAIRVGDTVLIGQNSLFSTGVVLSTRRVNDFCLSGYRELCLVQLENGQKVERWDDELSLVPPPQETLYPYPRVVPITALEQMVERRKVYRRFK